MIFDCDEESFTLSTGRKLYCNRLILGISPTEGNCLFDGYDSVQGEATDYTPDERREIAEYMVALWQQWAA